jgi:hypothetical protein
MRLARIVYEDEDPLYTLLFFQQPHKLIDKKNDWLIYKEWAHVLVC